MTFASSLNLLWLLPAWGAITALYFLRRPRRNVSVPSTMFWRSSPQESIKRAKVQRFTPQLLYFLQMLAALLVVLAIMQPELQNGLGQGAPVAIVIDNGITSQTSAESGNRLSQEKAIAVKLVHDSALRSSRFIVVGTAPATVISAPDAINSIEAMRASDSESDIPDAISAAASALKSLTKSRQLPQILLISDMAWPTSQDHDVAAASKGIPIAAYAVGSQSSDKAQNAAITRLSIHRSNIDPDNQLEIYAEVGSNTSMSGCTLTLTENGSEILSKQISTSPGSPASVAATISAPTKPGELTAQITPPASFDDSISDDNTAYATIPESGGLHVLLVYGGDTALENALSLLPGVHVIEISPYDYSLKGASGIFDITIFDGIAPDPAKPVSGGELIWGGGDKSFAYSEPQPIRQQVVDWSRSDPAMRFIDLGSSVLKMPSWSRVGTWTPLIESQDGIDAASTQQGGVRRIWTSFDPQESGFSANPAFPIFVSNCVNWLSGSDSDDTTTAGTPITLSRVQNGWQVDTPVSASYSGLCDLRGSPCSFADTSSAGFYRVISSGTNYELARNCSPTSLNLTAQVHDVGVNAALTTPGNATGLVKNWQAVTGVAVVICITLLFAEWIVFHKPFARKSKVVPSR